MLVSNQSRSHQGPTAAKRCFPVHAFSLAFQKGVRHLLAVAMVGGGAGFAAQWRIPAAGNAFRTAPVPGGNGFQRDGTITWNDSTAVYSLFFHVDRPAALDLSVVARGLGERAQIVASVAEKRFGADVTASELTPVALGQVDVDGAGYVRVDLRLAKADPASGIAIQELLVTSDTEGLVLDCVTTNDGNLFYWGRRGPSVHLRYEVPRGQSLQYAYTEITVPTGMDPIGSFYMANGFGEGYFGIQVNGAEERRVLFSVWSPFKTDNPRDIPEDQRILALAKGPDVRIGEFGNEGSGGQSFLVYPWQAGKTYRFLTEVKPDGTGNTTYTSWFGDKSEGTWRLIASFRRPMTDTYLRGFHSFLESFAPTYGYQERRADYGNVWVNDVEGHWHACTEARFSVDATGSGRHRLDFTGGSDGNVFYLRNCGFFSETGEPGATFTLEGTSTDPPEIDFDQLPRS